jgi:hypothetical protein
MKVKLVIPKNEIPDKINEAIKTNNNDWIIQRLNACEDIFLGETTIEMLETKEVAAIEINISITGGVPAMRKMIKENIQSWEIG